MSRKLSIPRFAVWLILAVTICSGCQLGKAVKQHHFAHKYVPGKNAIDRQGYPPACTTPMFYGYHGTCWRQWPEEWVPCPEVLEGTIVEEPQTPETVPGQPPVSPSTPGQPQVNPPIPGQPPMPNGGAAPMPNSARPMPSGGTAPMPNSGTPIPKSSVPNPNRSVPKANQGTPMPGSGSAREGTPMGGIPMPNAGGNAPRPAGNAPAVPKKNDRTSSNMSLPRLAPIAPPVADEIPAEPIPSRTRTSPPSRLPIDTPRSFDAGPRPAIRPPLTRNKNENVVNPTVTDSRQQKREDDRIAREIVTRLEQLKKQGVLRHFSVDLNVRHGVATLNGHVASRQSRRLIQDKIAAVAGLRGTRNLLQVVAPKLERVATAPVPPLQRTGLAKSAPPSDTPIRLRRPTTRLASQQIQREAPLPEPIAKNSLRAKVETTSKKTVSTSKAPAAVAKTPVAVAKKPLATSKKPVAVAKTPINLKAIPTRLATAPSIAPEAPQPEPLGRIVPSASSSDRVASRPNVQTAKPASKPALPTVAVEIPTVAPRSKRSLPDSPRASIVAESATVVAAGPDVRSAHVPFRQAQARVKKPARIRFIGGARPLPTRVKLRDNVAGKTRDTQTPAVRRKLRDMGPKTVRVRLNDRPAVSKPTRIRMNDTGDAELDVPSVKFDPIR